MKTYPTQAQLQSMVEYRDGVILSKLNGESIGWQNSDGYYRVYLMDFGEFGRSQLVWILHHGDIPGDLEIDHIDRNKSNDRIGNLRLADKSLQNLNKGVQKNNRLGVQGVTKRPCGKKPYKATFKGKFLSNFATVDEASKAYQQAKQEYMNV